MENQKKPDTAYFDLIKGGILLLLIVIFTFSLERGGDIALPAVSAATPSGTQTAGVTPDGSPSGTSAPLLTPGAPGIAPPVFTDDGMVVLSGTGVAGATVVIRANGEKIGEVPVSEGGIWVYRANPAPGDYEVVVIMQDSGGQVLNQTPPLEISVPPAGINPEAGATAPPEPGSTPVSGEGSQPSSPVIDETSVSESGEATVTGTGKPGSTVVIYENGVAAATAVVKEDGTFSVTYQPTSDEPAYEVRLEGAQPPEGGSPGEQPTPAGPEPTATSPEAIPGTPEPTQPPQPTPTPTLQPIPPGGLAYVVQPGDWLIDIARKFYGDPTRWVDIYVATNNKAFQDRSFAFLTDPNYVAAGWKIFIPEG